jgi:hypothetical protein
MTRAQRSLTQRKNADEVRRMDGDVQFLRSRVNWVHQHIFDAPETEFHTQLDLALRCAIRALHYLEQ